METQTMDVKKIMYSIHSTKISRMTLHMSEIWMFKIIRCSEDSFKVGKPGTTWDNGKTRNNATWNSCKLKYKNTLRFLEKKVP